MLRLKILLFVIVLFCLQATNLFSEKIEDIIFEHYVLDKANLLRPEEFQALKNILEKIEQETTNQEKETRLQKISDS